MKSNVTIRADRLMGRLQELARIGAIPGDGVCRLAFSEEDRRGRDYVEKVMREQGLDVYIDAIGNLMGVRPGIHNDDVVLTGSHTDTVATGGRYDGSLGVLAGLEVVQTLNDAGIETNHPIGVVSFVNEEGVRFMPDMMGSHYMAGHISLGEVRRIHSAGGETIGQCIDRHAFAGSASLDRWPIRCFIELHIEQGPVLEEKGPVIGIVDRVQGISWREVTFAGQTNHAGVTPMDRRRDAGFAAASLAYQVRRLASEIEGLRATAGTLTLEPNLINVIAGKATVTIDMRHPDADPLSRAEERLQAIVHEIAAAERVDVVQKQLARVDPVEFAPQCLDSIEQATRRLGYAYAYLPSGAGHDAQIMASRWPSAMIFVPSRGGISHSVEEYTRPEHIEAGANVLLHALLDQASPA